MTLPKFIKDIFDSFDLQSVSSWCRDFFEFFIRPRGVAKKFLMRPYSSQIKQLLFYSALLVIVVSLSFRGVEMNEGYRLIISIFAISFLAAALNSITFFIVARANYHFYKILAFVFLTWTIFSTPIFFCLSIFATSENYIFYFISNSLNCLAFFYSTFVIWNVFNSQWKRIVTGYLANILLMNVVFVIMSFFFFDSYSKTQSSDPILAELSSSLNGIEDFPGEPNSYYEEKLPGDSAMSRQFGFLNGDTVTLCNEDCIKIYRQILNENVTKIDSVSSKLHSSRNAAILAHLRAYYRNMSTYFDYKPCDTCLVQMITYISRNDSSKILGYRKHFVIDKAYVHPLERFKLEQDKLVRMNELATLPNYSINALFLPTQMMIWLLGVEVEYKSGYFQL